MTALSFAITGATFGLAKVVVYGTIGLVTPDPHRHASLTGPVEGVFMAGVLGGYWLFGSFIDPADKLAWLNVYWLLAGCAVGLAGLWALCPLDETPLQRDGQRSPVEAFLAMLALLRQPLVGRLPSLRLPVRPHRTGSWHLDADIQQRGSSPVATPQR